MFLKPSRLIPNRFEIALGLQTEVYLKRCQTSKMEFFVKLVNGFYLSSLKNCPRSLIGFRIRLWNSPEISLFLAYLFSSMLE